MVISPRVRSQAVGGVFVAGPAGNERGEKSHGKVGWGQEGMG